MKLSQVFGGAVAVVVLFLASCAAIAFCAVVLRVCWMCFQFALGI